MKSRVAANGAGPSRFGIAAVRTDVTTSLEALDDSLETYLGSKELA